MNWKLTCLIITLGFSTSILAQKKIVILHTNDTHSQIEALPLSNKKHSGKGGVVNRKAIIDDVRSKNKNVLLIDVGDFVQGSPYYNLFKGRVEAEAMNLMKYDVGVLGNHEFDYGLDTLKMVVEKLNYPIITSNYDFSNTVLKGKTKPYLIVKKDGLKIGIIGVGVSPDGLIPKSKYEGMIFNPIVSTANAYARKLKYQDNCDLIICVSHIGYNEDIKLAELSQNIDIILGGHSHTYMKEGEARKNKENKDVLVFQTGSLGINIGETVIEFTKTK